jgi:hypothetical protein
MTWLQKQLHALNVGPMAKTDEGTILSYTLTVGAIALVAAITGGLNIMCRV